MSATASRRLWETLRERRLVLLLTPKCAEDCVRAYEILEPLGVVVEIALRTDAAVEGIVAVRRAYPEALLLAGTVLSAAQVEQVIDAGAAGIVSPDYFPAVVEACVGKDVMCIPGGLSDVGKQLAQKAELYGCTVDELRIRHPHQWVYKVFPTITGPTSHLHIPGAWRSIYRDLLLMYSGGINETNLRDVMQADPGAAVCTSALGRVIEEPDRAVALVERWVSVVRGTPQKHPDVRPAMPSMGTSGTATVVAFGELLMRLSSPPGERLVQATRYDACFGGAEANVAVALANWGFDARLVSAVPAHELGEAVLRSLRGHAVDTRRVLRTGERLGVYYLEPGASQRPAKAIYDRAGSSITQLRPGQVDWSEVFSGARWFHWTGITAALGPGVLAVLAEAIQAARHAGVTISVDLNYRSKLWSPQQAREVMTPLVEQADIVIANEDDAANIFGIGIGAVDAASGDVDIEAYAGIASALVERFGLQLAAITLRQSHSASANGWSACLHDGDRFYQGQHHEIQVVDRVGAGDAFAAGLIHGCCVGKAPAETLDFAIAASCLKHTIRGDFNIASVGEIEALAGGNTAGRVKR